MAIEWSSPPAGKIEIPRSTPWSYTLPLRDTNVAVRWKCRALPRSSWEPDPDCPARINVLVPDDLDILFGELSWSVGTDGAETASGRIVFRVIEARRSPTAAPTVVADRTADTQAAPPPSPGVVSRPIADVVQTPNNEPREPKDAAAPGRPEASARYIEVIRSGVPVAGLRAEIHSGRTVTIGRGSMLEQYDLNLAGRFETDDHETSLSRRQAEVFCNDEGVFIRNIGRSPIKLVDSSGSPAGDIQADHLWSVGEVIALPGKLRVVLRET